MNAIAITLDLCSIAIIAMAYGMTARHHGRVEASDFALDVASAFVVVASIAIIVGAWWKL